MVQLPTIDIPQAQVDRLLQVFAGPNRTQAEAVANYRAWLKQALYNKVIEAETIAQRANAVQAFEDRVKAARDALPDVAPPPPPGQPPTA